jgi:S-adenosylmethionine hydrolase
MITLTSDFGASEYVGAMKGAIYSINSEAKVVDLTHNIKPFDIRHGAYAIYSTFPYFPKGTVHVVVVDPGVGTKRKGLILKSSGHYFVGPDNGVFSLLEADSIYEILGKNASSTFHGRDIFAPVAAKLDAGQQPQDFGREIEDDERIMKKDVEVFERIKGEVFCTDVFGNIITSIKREHVLDYGLRIGENLEIKVGERELRIPFVRTYGDVEKGEIAGLINSSDHFELSSREGSAAERLKVKGGEGLEVFS